MFDVLKWSSLDQPEGCRTDNKQTYRYAHDVHDEFQTASHVRLLTRQIRRGLRPRAMSNSGAAACLRGLGAFRRGTGPETRIRLRSETNVPDPHCVIVRLSR